MLKAPRKLQSLCTLLVVLCSSPAARAQVEPSDQASLTALMKSYYAAFARKDLGALVRLWSERSPDFAASIEEAQRAFGAEDYVFSNVTLSRVRISANKATLQVTADVTITAAQNKAARRETRVRGFAVIREGVEWKVWREASALEDLSAFLEKGSEWKVSRDSIGQFASVLLGARTDDERNRLLDDNRQMITVELREALVNRVGPSEAAGAHDTVIRIFRIVQTVAERMDDKEGIAAAHRGMGDAFRRSGRGAEALEHYRKALSAFEAIGSNRDKARILANIAGVLYGEKNYAGAIASYEKALAEYEALNNSPAVADTLEDIASVYYDQENYDRALEYFERCLKLREAKGGKAEIASTLNSIGNVYFQQQNYAAAIANYRKSLAGFEALGDADAVASGISNIGSALYSIGEYDAALEQYQKGLNLENKLRDRQVAANLRLSIAAVHTAQGNYGLAIETLRKAFEAFEALRNKNKMAGALSDIGEAYRQLRNYPLALERYQKSLRLYEELRSVADTSMRLYAIGNVHFMMGNFDLAIESYQNALAQFQSINHSPGVASMLASIGGVFFAQQKNDLAIEFYQKSLAQYEALGDKARGAGVTERIGSVCYSLRDYTRSLEWATRAVSMAEQAASLDSLWRARLTQGFAYRAMGQIEQAQQSFEQSIAAIESLRASLVRGEAGAERFFQSTNRAYVSMIELLVAQSRIPEAFEYAERIKSHQLRDILQSPRARITATMTADEQAGERALENEAVQLKSRISRERERKQPDEKRMSSLDARLKKTLSNYQEFEARLYAARPRLKMLRGEGEPLKLEQMTELPADGTTALLEFVVADSKTYLFALTRQTARRAAAARTGTPAFELNAYILNVGHSELAARVTKFREMIAARDDKVQQPAREIYDLLFSSAAAQLGGKTAWLIVPDDALWQLPFEALLSAENRYLIEDHAIAYAPSLTALAEMSKPPAKTRNVRQVTVALVASPVISEQAAARVKIEGGTEKLDPSPEAESEVKSLERIYGAARSRVYIGEQASERLLKQEVGRFGVIHIAAPALLSDATPMYSRIALSQSEENGSEDGLLETWELMKLQLEADFIVLSTTEVSAGKFGGGDAITALAWSLFVAGCPNAVVSKWATSSPSTTELMTEFHRNVEAAGTGSRIPASKAQALRRAILKMLGGRRYHPFYWAGFAVVGNAR